MNKRAITGKIERFWIRKNNHKAFYLTSFYCILQIESFQILKNVNQNKFNLLMTRKKQMKKLKLIDLSQTGRVFELKCMKEIGAEIVRSNQVGHINTWLTSWRCVASKKSIWSCENFSVYERYLQHGWRVWWACCHVYVVTMFLVFFVNSFKLRVVQSLPNRNNFIRKFDSRNRREKLILDVVK